ncbi:OLC1v1036102C1 [Oldenlandia corymbosa var. corymbosa]|uniref:OLC1v1036102C1 n=1 Tax=Oldenlandia corymbosa var. corymbosa TaxID=529605 RepID=A0AAV1CUY9_OLDCO|nr:OLC1v1036102C1 [Oldenlandia corymbosa var. corymbosa]
MDLNNFGWEGKEGKKNQPEYVGFVVSSGSFGSSKIQAFGGSKAREEGSFLVEKSVGFSSKDTPSFPVYHKHKDGILLEKLKISPKSSQDSGVLNSPSDDDTNNKKYAYFCKECNKGFSCGKALGGHMSSAHVQAKAHLRKLKIRQSEKFIKGYDGLLGSAFHGDQEEEEERYVCKLCGKEFPGSRSLYGHMRCHPDRNWRGMEPPSSKAKTLRARNRATSVVVVDDVHGRKYEDHVYSDMHEAEERVLESVGSDPAEDRSRDIGFSGLKDLSNALGGGWGITGKRGREAAMVKLDVEMERKEDLEMYEAVTQLIRLVNSGKAAENYQK